MCLGRRCEGLLLRRAWRGDSSLERGELSPVPRLVPRPAAGSGLGELAVSTFTSLEFFFLL